MAKKSKRKVSQVQAAGSAPVVAEGQAVDSPAARAATSRRATTVAEFNPDYTYVIKDLKRIGTLAGTFFVVLIVLSFIIK
jgi:hypothetical protein